jgi:5-carboxymethyl-2-hydroxymuconate isomerase
MPQITLEYSDNVKVGDLKSALLGLHQILSKMLPTQVESCKSRIIRHKDYLIGDGDERNAFVHVDIKIMAGRTEDVVNNTGKAAVEYLRDQFQDSDGLNLQITVEISNLSAYFKYSK